MIFNIGSLVINKLPSFFWIYTKKGDVIRKLVLINNITVRITSVIPELPEQGFLVINIGGYRI